MLDRKTATIGDDTIPETLMRASVLTVVGGSE